MIAMAFHPTILATGSFASAEDPIVALLIAENEIDPIDVDNALRAGRPAPFIAILGEIEFTSTAHVLCHELDVHPEMASRRFATAERVAAAAKDFELREEMERHGALDLLDLMASFAAAGAAISVVP